MEATLTSTLPPLVANLRSLHVHWNSCVTDEFLSWAIQSLPRLEVRFGVVRCERLQPGPFFVVPPVGRLGKRRRDLRCLCRMGWSFVRLAGVVSVLR